MTYREFINRVQDHSGFSDSEAEEATRIFMQTLTSRVTQGEADDLISQLPPEIQEMAIAGAPTRPERLSGNEFLERIAQTQGITSEHAKKQMFAVWLTLKEAVSEGEIAHLKEQLPPEFARIFY